MTAQNLRELLEGDMLSAREVQILEAAARGESCKQTARRLYLAFDTVRQYRKQACAKLGCSNMTRAVVLAIAAGELDADRLVDLDGA